MIVENRPGQGGRIVLASLAQSPADGHTLVLAPLASLVVNPHLYKSIAYNTRKDFAPVALVADLPALAARPAGARLVVVVGTLASKNHDAIVAALASHADALVMTRPEVAGKPTADPATLAATARRAGFGGPITVEEAASLMTEAGFVDVEDREFGGQVVMLGRRP